MSLKMHFFKEGAKRESEAINGLWLTMLCGKMRPIIIESHILFDYTFPDIFAQNLFFFLVFKFEMEFCQLNKGVSSVQEQGNASYSLDEGPSAQFDDMLNKLIENLLDQKIDPFIVYSHDSIKAQVADIEPQDANIKDKILGYCRKQKSLAELSRRFVNRFEGTGKNVIALDQVTAELKVERRRIYDIINIMESLGVVSKIKKNLYQWNGLIEAIETIRIYAEGKQPVKPEKNKKEKSLQSLASQFLKLFINFSGVLTLDEAADQILKSSTDTDSRKTKIRRLYDIVNVFKCIELVEKISISGEKSGFRWKGCNELLKFIEEKNNSPFHSFDQVSEESFDKISLSEKMSVTKKTTEEFKSNRIEDTIQTKARQDIEIIEFKRSEEQMKESDDEMQGMSYFQQMILKMNPEKKREFDLKAEFKKQMWPIQEGIGEIQY